MNTFLMILKERDFQTYELLILTVCGDPTLPAKMLTVVTCPESNGPTLPTGNL
jgi:hypothetical protein